jgi:prepilin-type processing-associated H-X9-DG protein
MAKIPPNACPDRRQQSKPGFLVVIIMNCNSVNRNAGHRAMQAFTRLDLIVLLVLITVLLAFIGLGRTGERGRVARCAGNLAALGDAMQSYVHEHNGALPTAGISLGKFQSSWDMQVFPYLGSGLDKASNQKLAETVPRFFACPSDKAPHRGKMRSYAMGGNDMAPKNWPPGQESATGVGLWWDWQTVTTLADDDALKKPDTLPTLALSTIPVPTDTVLLTELIDPNNSMAGTGQTRVIGAGQQRQVFKDGGAQFHYGKFNYLMADGHVEKLSPLQTGSFDGTAGIWSMKK